MMAGVLAFQSGRLSENAYRARMEACTEESLARCAT